MTLEDVSCALDLEGASRRSTDSSPGKATVALPEGEVLEEAVVPVASDADVVTARSLGRSLAEGIGFSSTDLTLIATAISEVARNITTYAGRGEIAVRVMTRNGRTGIIVVARDEGPGIEDGVVGPLCWAAAGAALAGEARSGDIHIVRPLDDVVLLAVVDGLGHGPGAAHAAEVAARALCDHDFRSVTEALQHCHGSLHETRGVVMTLASVDTRQGSLEWLGVGNVDGMIVRGDRDARSESVLLSGGVVGYQLPRLRPRRLELAPGDMVVMTTDGIGPDFPTSLIRSDSPAGNASRVLKHHRRVNDDALVLVACWEQEHAPR